jgi:hypothetical protein
MPIAGLFQIGSNLSDESRIVDEHGPPFAAFPQDVQMLVVRGEIEVFDMETERLADAKAGLEDQAEEQTVAFLLRGNGGQDLLGFLATDSPRKRRLPLDAVDLLHGIGRKVVVAIGPSEEAGDRRLFSGASSGRKFTKLEPEFPQSLDGEIVGGTGMKRGELC